MSVKTAPCDHVTFLPFLVYAAIAITFVWQVVQRNSTLEARFAALAPAWKIAAISASLFAVFLCSGGDERAFIYFQF